MPKRIPIARARDFAKLLGLKQVIIGAWDGERTHVVTYGVTVTDCKQAAEGGNKFKRAMGFPEELCNTQPARAKKKDT